jgi:hypothetical protein
MTSEQTQHQQAASSNRTLLSSVNHGRPDVAATPRPGQFNRRGAAETRRPIAPNRPLENPRETNRPGKPPANNGRTFEDRPPSSRPSNVPRVNPGLEQKQQREIEKMRQQQDADRQKVQQRHVQEQQKLERQRPDQRQQEQLQRRQQQQLGQMQQKHAQQEQKLQERQQRDVQNQEKKQPKSDRPPGHQQ